MFAQIFWHLLSSNQNADTLIAEEFMDLPECPACSSGKLLPLSKDHQPFGMWICSNPSCGYTLSQNTAPQGYYKGFAAIKEVEKGEKRWNEFHF